MEIQALRLLVGEDEINKALPRLIPPDAGIENLRIRLVPEGLVVQGEYPTFMLRMSFETLWEVAAEAGRVRARLSTVKVAGLPATLLRGVLLKVIRDATAQQPGIVVQEDSITVEPAPLLKAKEIPVTLYLTAVRPGLGHLFIEAGPPVA
jgi:hypothetical protein